MSVPTGSQPQISATLPRPPAMLGQASFGSASLTSPAQGGILPRPLPTPPILSVRPPGQQIRPGPAPSAPVVLNPPRDGKIAPSIMPPKQTTLYVGKIAPSISDSLIKQLLDACGPVKSWKRMEDPDTKALKAFGFCEFEEADGVIRALSLLQNLSIGGQELLLKCNTGTQKYIDEMESRKAAASSVPPSGEEEGQQSAAEMDNAALEKIMGLVSSHAQALPPPPEAVAAADSFLSSLKSESEKKEKSGRERARSRRDSRDDEDGKSLEATVQRERDVERREHEARVHEQDQAYKAALRKWEVQEMDIRKNLEREKDHERDIAKERRRQLKADLEADNDAEDSWQRKLYAGSRRASDRKRWREKEQQEDDADRVREEEERAKRAKTSEKEEANGHLGGELNMSPGLQAMAHARLQDPYDSITQAMMNAAKAPRQPEVSSPANSPSIAQIDRQRSETAAAQPKPKRPLAAFGGDEEDDQPKRTLKPLTYTEEEEKAAKRAVPASLKDKQQAVKEVIAKVPTETKAVFVYPIDWKAYDDGGDTLKDRIRKWVAKKTGELLGLEEASMVDYIMGLLAEHTSAKKVLEALKEVLDEETNPFVFKLFRMVIFETLKQAANLQD